MPFQELIRQLTDLDLNTGDTIPTAAVADASAQIAGVYSQLLAAGISDVVVARAMIGATIVLYDAVGLLDVLPTVLRTVADKIEADRLLPH